jgi:hypothetical protein
MKAVVGGLGHRSSIKKTLNMVSVVLPILIATIGYALEVESNEGENAKLNTIRHAFTCSMRFRDMKTEWLAIWIWDMMKMIMASYQSSNKHEQYFVSTLKSLRSDWLRI